MPSVREATATERAQRLAGRVSALNEALQVFNGACVRSGVSGLVASQPLASSNTASDEACFNALTTFQSWLFETADVELTECTMLMEELAMAAGGLLASETAKAQIGAPVRSIFLGVPSLKG